MKSLSAKSTSSFLGFLEIVLVLAAMVGIKVAQTTTEDQGFIFFVIYATYAALVPITLAALCHGMRILIRKEINND